MKRLKHKFKKGMAFVLSLAMVAGLIPAMSGGATVVKAETGNGTGSEPSVSAFATKTQLMDGTFAPNSSGEATNIGKLVFGKKSDGTTAQEWYILGKDTGVSGDNTIIFAASPIATNQVFEDDIDNIKTDASLWSDCDYNGVSITEVYPNHYGASDLRVTLQGMATNTNYFTAAEQGLMNPTTVTTKDTYNSVTYTTTDKLYALQGDFEGQKLWAGTSDGTVLAMNSYWSNGGMFWLRSPSGGIGFGALLANPGSYVNINFVDLDYAVQPASNLNLSSVLFASSAQAASSDTAESGTIADDTAMTLRLNGTGKNIGAAIYNAEAGTIEVRKGSTTQTVALVVQGNDGTNDWYYSKKIDASETINASDIVSETNTPASIDLSVCKIWLEITDTNGLIYAVDAEKEIKPINTTYVNKEQLMNSFKPYSDGTAVNIGKLAFGKDYNEEAQQWYILGKDDGVSGDNTIIFAASPIATNQVFEDDEYSDKTFESGFGVYTRNPTDVYPNHYGASDLRVVLKSMATNTSYFTTAEQGLMNDTTVTTKDTKNKDSSDNYLNYTTTDKLYALQGDYNNVKYLRIGTNDNTVLAMSSYWGTQVDSEFWLRSPYVGDSDDALLAHPGKYVTIFAVNGNFAVQPASNLNLSSVLFASGATAASSDTAVAETIANENGTAMTLRLDGTGKNIGTVTYNTTTGDIKATKGSTEGDVALVVQGNDGTNDWYYSKKITGTETVKENASEIKSALSLSSDINLSDCNIWLETTDTNGLIYAVDAEKEIEQINTTYVTKEQLMNSFKTYSDGTAVNIGKLAFGKDYNEEAQQWYILGKDDGVSGDNTIIFAASSIATGQVFNPDTSHRYDYEAGTGYGDTAGNIVVCPNHYGASDLRVALQSMATNTAYFTTAEQGLMNATTVTTKDMMNKDGSGNYLNYTTTDKLYALSADGSGSSYTTIKAGTSDSTVLAMNSYWSSGSSFWLRSPYGSIGLSVLYASSNGCSFNHPNESIAVQPASNLKLSSVLFASGATAASSDTLSDTVSGTITEGTAMTLRLDGTGKNIGTVTYNTTTGDIKATKGSTEGDVALVVQGNDGTSGWYYSKQITGTEVVNVTTIASETNTPELIDLSTCKIWLEITDTDDRMTYAVNATETTIKIIHSVAITDIETTAANTTLDTEASCETTGVSSTTPQITWTPIDSTAGYNTSYTASITLTADTGYEFIGSTTATVLGNTATSVTKNADGTTLTVKYDFPATAKRKIDSVTAPTAPTNNTFTTYYGYDGYDAILSDGENSELGTQAEVTFEETVAPTTLVFGVTWTIESGGGVYDKTPGADNTFRWTIPASALTNYNAADCANYDSASGTITGTVTITNKAAVPVNITGTDSGISYIGATIDVSPYFTIDSNAGTATYSLVTGTDGTTGEGSLDGSTLTVTKTGTFKIKVSTAANGIYGAGEKLITLTVDNGIIEYTATDYSTTYDGQAHSISVNVSNPEGTTITYSTDGTTYGSDNPSFTNAGTYTVYYRITKDNYTTIEGSKTVTINKKPVTITAENQDIVWGNVIDRSKYTVSADGLAAGDSISEITLTPSTSSLTENGTISISGVKIENAEGADVTGNYDITTGNAALKIAHNTTLPLDRIEAVKTKTSYTVKDTLNLDDMTVTAYYTDGYSEVVTDFTTNADGIDMTTAGEKTLTVSYTKNGATKTKDIAITVIKDETDTVEWKEEDGVKYWYEDGVKQGTQGRGKEIYDPSTNAWYFLDAADGGKMATNKDVAQPTDWDAYNSDPDGYGLDDSKWKWVRYDENGHMVKGWDNNENGVYYFDPVTGQMAKGSVEIDNKACYFDEVTGVGADVKWITLDGVEYWYEGGVRQGYEKGNEAYRGKEIYDPDTNAWYWLDNIDGGKKAVSKDVYQESLAGDWGDMTNEAGEKIGKWVRYDADGHMVKGWCAGKDADAKVISSPADAENGAVYYFDPIFGTMAKGTAVIDGVKYTFDTNTGVLIR